VIPTKDTERHRELVYNWLQDHLPVILCGPPGSGKTMTLTEALRNAGDGDSGRFKLVLLNFSASSKPDLILDTFKQHCKIKTNKDGLVLYPDTQYDDEWLVVFCDEINLPSTDDYDTVQVITFLRQLIEHGGYYRAEDMKWVTLERIQFVGACNPPTDPGRVPLDPRFLRHVPVIYVDYPSKESYKQIYLAFNKAITKVFHPRSHHEGVSPIT